MVAIHAAYHSKIEMLLAARSARNLPTNLVALHSFTPVLQKQIRPWHAGIIFEQDKIAQRLIAALRRETWLVVGENEPYSAAQGVYYTIARHEKQLHRPGVMVEIRNDLIRDAAGQIQWADRLSDALLEAYGVDMSSRKRIAEVSQP
jgi:predicted N-formylglutamate amidohydrolase